MKPEEQRIAIAEAVGCINVKMWGDSCIASLGIDNNGNCWGSYVVKDYLNDLNAMHEAENVLLIDDQQRMYVDTLVWLNNGGNSSIRFHGRWAAATATAAQRAEAFLRTVGKWATNPN